MICYMDTSALVKLYVQEEGSDSVHALVDEARLIATCKVAFAEARAALARAFRSRVIDEKVYRGVVRALYGDWDNYFRIEVSDSLIMLAGDLAEEHSLRGFDAIHLAAVHILSQQIGESITVACWDAHLWDALAKYEVSLVPSSRPGTHRN